MRWLSSSLSRPVFDRTFNFGSIFSLNETVDGWVDFNMNPFRLHRRAND